MNIELYEINLSIQRALLDRVTSNLRRISYVLKDKLITIYFYYDGEISEIDNELVADAAAEIISDFPDEYDINWELRSVRFPEKISSKGQIVFSRYENETLNDLSCL